MTRPATSRLRWALTTLRRYSASASPRSAMMRWRMASISAPNSSSSAAVSLRYGLLMRIPFRSEVVVLVAQIRDPRCLLRRSEIHGAVALGGADADADVFVG